MFDKSNKCRTLGINTRGRNPALTGLSDNGRTRIAPGLTGMTADLHLYVVREGRQSGRSSKRR